MSALLTVAAEILDELLQPGADPRHPEQPRHVVATSRMADAQRGHPGSPSTAPGRTTDPGSPVERAAEQPDIGGDALTEWQRALRQLTTATRTLDRLATAWTPRLPSAKAQRDTEAANVRLCDHCGDDHPHTATPTDVAGNLAEPMLLCRWCWDITRRIGRLPDQTMLRRHRLGMRVMVDAS